MSEQTQGNQLEAMVLTLSSAFEDVVKMAIGDATGDIDEYSQLLSAEYTRYLWKAYQESNEAAQRDLGHLKAQVAIIAVKRQVIMTREALERLRLALETAASIGVRVLVTAATAAL